MTVLTLPEIKTHLRLDESETAEDALLESLNEAAHDYASQYLGRPLPWLDDDGLPVVVPPSVRAALLLIIGDLYEHREGQIVGATIVDNPAVERLLHFYRVGLGV